MESDKSEHKSINDDSDNDDDYNKGDSDHDGDSDNSDNEQDLNASEEITKRCITPIPVEIHAKNSEEKSEKDIKEEQEAVSEQ